MCAIAGGFDYSGGGRIDAERIERMADSMSARGPDGAGCWSNADQRVAMSHRRLAIIEPGPDGAQPMRLDDCGLVLVFNGEIYNHAALREQMQACGDRFRSCSDSEVILRGFARYGLGLLPRLRGMFALAIWDSRTSSLVLARDFFGIKPCYYLDDGARVLFASQVKAFSAARIPLSPDPAGVVGYWIWGNVPEPFTCHAEVSALPAGHALIVEQGTTRLHEFQPQVDALAPLPQVMSDSVRAHLVADVEVGCFLSSGVDSGIVAGLAARHMDRPLKTLTIAFDAFRGSSDDEAPGAQQIARHFGCDHQTRRVNREEFEEELPRILEAMDQPTIDGVNTWFASKGAVERGLKVVLSGLGGDEMFGGYPSFRNIPRWLGWMSIPARIPRFGALLRRLAGPLVRAAGLSPKAAGLLEYASTLPRAYMLQRALFMPWELDALVEPDVLREGMERLELERRLEQVSRLPFNGARTIDRIASLEQGLYMRNQLLRDTDWASMAHSLEVRVPMVDALVAACARHQRNDSHKDLRGIVKPELPGALHNRVKTGFGTPLHQWLHRPSGHAGEPWARQWARQVMADAAAQWPHHG